MLRYRQRREGKIAFTNDRRPDFLVIFPVAYQALADASFLKVVTYASVQDNTASLLDFQPRPQTIAGLLTLDLVVQPVPVMLAVFKCTWPLFWGR